MATLQKFKFLATQCAVIGSPNRSPTTSPVIRLRRRKTLRMLLGRSSNNNHHPRRSPDEIDDEKEEDRRRQQQQQQHRHQICVRHKLKDLFVSSPPPINESTGMVPESGGSVVVAGKIGAGAMRPLSATLRQRLLRRAWRPVLVAIPEMSP